MQDTGSGAKARTRPVPARRQRGLDRTLDLLDLLHRQRRPLRIPDLARELGAPRSTIYEIINRLLAAGIVETYDDGKVFFGKTVHFYAADYMAAHNLIRRARDEVDRLATETGETTQFCMLHGNKYTVVHMHAGARPFRISSEIGVGIPLPWTASGRLLLSHLTEDELRAFVPKSDLRLPDGQTIGLGEFYRQIQQARRNGYCITEGLVDSFTQCLAAPVSDHDERVVATICFMLPRDVVGKDRDRLLGLLLRSGRSLSVFAGAAGEPTPPRRQRRPATDKA
jgi:DNA-binding IclR family transcriptional regulator